MTEHSVEKDALRAALDAMLQKRHFTEYASRTCPCCNAVREVLVSVFPPGKGDAR